MRSAAYLLVSARGRPIRFIIASTRADRAQAFADARRINGVLVRAAVRLDCRPRRHRHRVRRRDRVAEAVRGILAPVREVFGPARPRADEFDANREQLIAEFGEDGFRRLRERVRAFYLAWPR